MRRVAAPRAPALPSARPPLAAPRAARPAPPHAALPARSISGVVKVGKFKPKAVLEVVRARMCVFSLLTLRSLRPHKSGSKRLFTMHHQKAQRPFVSALRVVAVMA